MTASETGAADWLEGELRPGRSLADRVRVTALILFVKALLHPGERVVDDLGPDGSSHEGEEDRNNHWDDPALWMLMMH